MMPLRALQGDGKGSQKQHFPPRADAPPEGSLELEHIYG